MAAVRVRPATTGEDMELTKTPAMLGAAIKPSEGAMVATDRDIELLPVGAQHDSETTSIAGPPKDEEGIPDGTSDSELPDYPQGWKLLAIVAALCLAVFLVALDQTIIATAIPRITDQFHSLDDVAWQVSLRLAAREHQSP